jgi:hypothetical protein
MHKERIKGLKSIKNFKKNIKQTYIFFHGLETKIIALKTFLTILNAKNNPNYKKFEQFLEFKKKHIAYLYEVGFIALFANFESFMLDLLKDLFRKYPHSFKCEKLARFDEIEDFKNIKEVKEYFIDSLAIEKSYGGIESWTDCLGQKFRIKVFKTKKQFKLLRMLNELRNVFLHAGGKTTSKFRNKMKTFIKSEVPLNQKITLDRKKYFEVLYHILFSLAINIENN